MKVLRVIRDLLELLGNTDDQLYIRVVRRDKYDSVTHVSFVPIRSSPGLSKDGLFLRVEESDICMLEE